MADQAKENIFTDDNAVIESTEQTTPQDSTNENPTLTLPDEVRDLVGEGKKYATLEQALSSIPHAQNHIAKIEAENQEFRDRLLKIEEGMATQESLEEMLHKIQEASSNPSEDTPTQPQVSKEDISELVRQTLKQEEAAKLASQNIKSVVNTMVDSYGDKQKAEQAYIEKAEEFGFSVEDMNSLAAKSPKALLKMFGLDKKGSSEPTKMKSTINTENFSQTTEQPIKSVMAGASKEELISAWRNSAPKVS